ncbi:MAG: D-alanine--D-alanine ligase [Planctomycetota bacterium]
MDASSTKLRGSGNMSKPEPQRQNPPCRGARLRVTVLCGGPSAEREVSLVSGRAVADALRRRGHDVFIADIGPEQIEALDQPADVVFPALHGTFGEDGTLQRLMEHRGLRYVGSDASSSALSIDKVASKRAVLAAGIPTPAYEVWVACSNGVAVPEDHDPVSPAPAAPLIPLPVIVKPVDQGSSVGTTIVRHAHEFPAAIRETTRLFQRALVEQFIAGEELTVGIVGRDALPPIVIRPKRQFYDYVAKYEDDATEYLFDAGYPAELLEEAQALSLRVFAQLGCRHLARVDWMIDRAGRLWFLEVNTIPGFTTHSLVPKAAAHAGIGFDELVERLVFMACAGSPA